MKSIMAGIMIGIAGTIYCRYPSYIGAILFSIGLLVICLRGYNLFTGKIGYCKSGIDFVKVAVVLLLNLMGVAIVAVVGIADGTELVEAKLQIPHYLLLIRSIGCGILMFLAVDIYKNNKSILGVLTCVPAFILAGLEHSIADSFYIFASGIITWHSIAIILITVIGNTIGGQLCRFYQFYYQKWQPKLVELYKQKLKK